MAKITTSVNERVIGIQKWLGVNEAPEGDSRLQYGEAAEMRNFQVTAGGALRKRPGSRSVAGLMAQYSVHTDTETQCTLVTEYGVPNDTLTLYPRAETDSVGKVVTAGDGVSVTCANAADYIGYYYASGDGVYAFSGVEAVPASGGEAVPGGAVSYGAHESQGTWLYNLTDPQNPEELGPMSLDVYPTLSIADNALVLSGTPETKTHAIRGTGWAETDRPAGGWFMTTEGCFRYYGQYVEYDDYRIWIGQWRGERVTFTADEYHWNFHPTRAVGTGSDKQVRGLWSGFVGESEVLCAACSGHLWELTRDENGVWSKTDCGTVSTAGNVHMFGFDKKLWLLNGTQYRVWDGTTLADVSGYRPLVSVAVAPGGGGTAFEQVNKLTGARRCRFSPDGTGTVFQLPETGLASVDYVRDLAAGADMPASAYTADLTAGTVTFAAAPARGVSSVEVGWTVSDTDRSRVLGMRFAELYNGAQDSRVFLYGDGSNQALYSGLDTDGQARADYFPDLNVVNVGDANTPITAMIRHYSRLLAFKLDSAYSIYYDTLSLADGSLTAAFYVTPVNRDVGSCAYGQAVLVENRPRTLDGRSVIEWKATSTSGNITGDTRNAQRVSQRVDRTIRTFDLTKSVTFYDKYTHEYYVIGADGTALVNNVEADAWYVYTGFAAVRLIVYRDELYFGTADGELRHCSAAYPDDAGAAIPAVWESGSMSFGEDYRRKYSAMLWVGIRPEDNGYLKVTAETDQRSDFAEYAFSTASAEALPEMNRIKLKAKKFTYYKLKLENDTADKTATVVSADIRVRGTGYVR